MRFGAWQGHREREGVGEHEKVKGNEERTREGDRERQGEMEEMQSERVTETARERWRMPGRNGDT